MSNTLGVKEKVVIVQQNVTLAKPTQDSSSTYRQVLYGGLSLVLVSFIWSSSSGEMSFRMLQFLVLS